MVVGDLMLDRYLWGRADRISPEAPVPVVEVIKEENRPGGAANVALNLRTMGAEVIVCGLVGKDSDGDLLLDQARIHGFRQELIFASPNRRTTVKVRVLAGTQHLLRVDREDKFPLSAEESALLTAKTIAEIASCDAIVLEDYDKGLLQPDFIQALIQEANRQNKPVLVDPKFRQFWQYAGCTVFKPNLKELNEALGLSLVKNDLSGIADASRLLQERMPHTYTLVTLSEQGMLLVPTGEAAIHIPAHPRQISDVSGAGDTVVGVAALSLAAGLEMKQAAYLANLAGGLVCEVAGVAPITPEWLAGALPKS